MVITASKELKLKYGALSKSVLEAAGPDIQTACDNNYPSGVDYGDVAATRAYKLHCRFVYFGSLPDWKNTSDNPQQVGRIQFKNSGLNVQVNIFQFFHNIFLCQKPMLCQV